MRIQNGYSRTLHCQQEHCCRKDGYVTRDLRLNKNICGRAHYFVEEKRLEAFPKMTETCLDPRRVVFATASSSHGRIVVAGFFSNRMGP
ncbi:hypothetical protein MRX96_015178 [Rhipicephalus microplus]